MEKSLIEMVEDLYDCLSPAGKERYLDYLNNGGLI